mmetsp:Transcript_19588/g.60572  ORF Transcript_19588/g.60572 Transcript_19588/m.60572 type:complete len:182 (-) Transcript_19588:4253-4798(-)
MRQGEADAEELAQQVRAYDVALAALDAEVESVENGTHPEYLRRCKRLQQAKNQREDRARRAYDMSVHTLERLQELEMDEARKQMERGLELAREKVADQVLAKAKGRDTTGEDGVRVSTRNLRSKHTGLNEDGERSTTRRTTNRRGAQSPASVLLDKGLPDSVMEQDFQTIEAAATKRQRLS